MRNIRKEKGEKKVKRRGRRGWGRWKREYIGKKKRKEVKERYRSVKNGGEEKPRKKEKMCNMWWSMETIAEIKVVKKKYQKYSVYEHDILHVSKQCVRI